MPDGRWLAIERYDPKTRHDICLLGTGAERKLQPLLNSRFIEVEPEFSPDGRLLMMKASSGGINELHVILNWTALLKQPGARSAGQR